MTLYNYRQAIRDALPSSLQPTEIAAKVAENIPAEHLLGVVVDVLPWVVRDEIRTLRGVVLNPRDSSPPGYAAALRERVMSLPVYVDDPGIWRRLGDLTADDCERIAAGYIRRADRNRRFAKAYQRLAAEVREVGAASVGDLDPATVQEIMP